MRKREAGKGLKNEPRNTRTTRKKEKVVSCEKREENNPQIRRFTQMKMGCYSQKKNRKNIATKKLGAAFGRNQNNYYCQCLPKKSSFFGAPNLTFFDFYKKGCSAGESNKLKIRVFRIIRYSI